MISVRQGCSPSSFHHPSEGRVLDGPVHLQRGHLYVWDLVVLGPSRRAVPGRASHRAKAHGGASCLGQTGRSRDGRTAQEPARCDQVPVALRVREGVAGASGAGASDVGAPRWRRGCGFGLPHLEHQLERKGIQRQTSDGVKGTSDLQTQMFDWHILKTVKVTCCWSYLIINGGAELDQQETVGHHRKYTQDGGEKDGQPHIWLVQRVPGCA